MKQGGYSDLEITKIIFNFGILDGKIEVNHDHMELKNKVIPHLNYSHYKLLNLWFINPFDDIKKYGKIILFNDLSINQETNITYAIQAENGNNFVINTKGDNDQLTNYVKLYKNGQLLVEYSDKSNKDSSSFIRLIGTRTYLFDNGGEQLLLTQDKKIHKYIENKKIDDKNNNNFVSCDIETYNTSGNDSNLVPYLIAIYDGYENHSFYLTDYNNSNDMIIDCINRLCDIAQIRQEAKLGKTLYVYFHNLAHFDSLFIMKSVMSIDKNNSFTPIFNNGKLISFKYVRNFSESKHINLVFYDSLQLLPSSLAKLAEFFNDDKGQKGIFNHTLINENNLLEYKNEAIKYCNQDCYSLYEILSRFNELIWDKWKVNIIKYPTISSLAFSIFRTHYIGDNKIPMIGGDMFTDIKLGYTGGSTEMFIPLFEGKESAKNYVEANIDRVAKAVDHEELFLYYYDINSLYPFIMASTELPCGSITYFEGNILKYKKDAIGFYYCKVTTPISLKHPIIQIHHNNRTVSPLGSFEGMFYSKEIENAIKLGYKFEVLWGYTFSDRKIIFKDYVDSLYDLRLSYDKKHPMNLIAKLLMNSLYGRFGMDDNHSSITLMDQKDYSNYISKFNINKEKYILAVDEIKFDDNTSKFLVETISDSSNIRINTNFQTHNTSIGIAAAITSEARIYMSIFKNIPGVELYYTDTDSIFINNSPSELNRIIDGCFASG